MVSGRHKDSRHLCNSCMMDIHNILAIHSSHDKLIQIPPNPSYHHRPLDHQHSQGLGLQLVSNLLEIVAMEWRMKQRRGKERQRSMSRCYGKKRIF